MVPRSWLAGGLALGAVTFALWASQPLAAPPQSSTPSGQPASSPTVVVLPWGAGHGEVGLRHAKPHQPAEGVTSVALAADGSTLLLDRVNHRVVRVGPSGSASDAWVLTGAPADAEDVAVAQDGAIGLYSPLRARFWVHEGTHVVAELNVPRGLRELVSIDFGPSRLVLARSAHQETYRLGSPSTPQTLPSVLQSKREGAFELPDGSGVATKLDAQQRPLLLVIDNGKDRARVLRSFPVLGKPVVSARVVGVRDGVACVRLEHEAPGSVIQTSRSVACLTTTSGSKVLESDLGPVDDVYVPRRSFAMGGSPARLVFMQPRPTGLHVTTWAVPRAAEGGTP
jgi:hypothetical protein